MATLTYFVVLPFFRSEDGDLMADEAIEVPNAGAAKRQAERVARAKGGAVAFSRTGDAAIGEYAPAVILASFGDVPEDLSEFTG
jgi:hypothetical protein